MSGMSDTGSSQFSLRVDILAPHIMKAMESLDAEADKVSLPVSLLELVRVRTSQVNGCAFCVEAHSQAARDNGVSERRLQTLVAWRDSPFFSSRERAALELAERITLMSRERVSNTTWEAVSQEFSEVELAELTWTIAVINVWNRIAGTAHPWPVG